MRLRTQSAGFIWMLTFGILFSIAITAWADDTRKIKMTDMVVTASRAEEDPASVSANVTVISADDILASSAISVVDVLKNVAGLNVADWTGTGRMARVDIRGFGETAGANTLVVVDGRRINAPDLSGVDWTTIPLDRIERIEIIRGGGSVLYGNHATGGVINIITQKGAERHTATISTAFGSYDFFNQSAGLAGSTQRMTYSFHGNYMETDGFRDNSDLRNKSAGLNIGFTEDRYGIDLSAGIKDDSYGMPGHIVEGDQRRTIASTPDDFAESRDQYVQVTPRLLLTSTSDLSLAMWGRKFYYHSENVGWWGVSELEYELNDYGVSPQYTQRFNLFEMPHNLVVGFDYLHSELEYIEGFLVGQDRTRKETGFFIHNKMMPVEDVYFNFGFRSARVSYDIDNGASDSFNINAATAGLTFNYAQDSKIFASIERGFRMALLDELGGGAFNEILDPQIGFHYQAGISHRINPFAKIGATLFRIDTRDEIFFNPFATFNSEWGWSGENENYRRTRRQGIELEMAVNPHDKVKLSGNYTWMKNELRGGEFDGNDIPGAATQMALASVTIFPITDLSFDMRARWVEGKTMISDWQNEVRGNWEGGEYIVVDAMLSYALGLASINLGVNNVFDEEYSEYGTYSNDVRNIYPSPKRNYFSEVRLAYEF